MDSDVISGLFRSVADNSEYVSVNSYDAFLKAKDMGYDIPEPFSVEEIFYMKQNKHFMNTDIRRKGLLVDEAQIVLQQFFAPAKIWGTTVTDFGDNIEYLNSDEGKGDLHDPEQE